MAEERFETALKNALARHNRETSAETDTEIPAMSAAFLARMDDRVRNRDTKREGFGMTKNLKNTWKKAWTAAICAALLLAATGCVYAAVPAVREYINMLFLRTDSVTRLTEVPEGWVGIYTAEDLETIREDMEGNYILMNDIVIPDAFYEPGGIYENGFTPIGGGCFSYTVTDENSSDLDFFKNTAFCGTFNGNGYVISNLHIRQADSSSYGTYSGLFGRSIMINAGSVDDPVTGVPYRKFTGGIIKNLGITDSSVEITFTDAYDPYYLSDINIGMIAGHCDFVVGCYTKNVTVSVTFDSSIVDAVDIGRSLKLGGVAGKTTVTDSCWSDGEISLHIDGAEGAASPYVAGVTGFTTSCVTSYFNGSIHMSGDDCGTAGIDSTTPPILLSDAVMDEIQNRLLAAEDEWSFYKLASFYTMCRADEMQMYVTSDVSATSGFFYIVDPMIKARERAELSAVIANAFAGDEFIAFCQENDVKYGAYDNYDLRSTPDTDFDGFDFTYIWRMGEDGLPKLRLFGYGK